jgi:hypothetical protein
MGTIRVMGASGDTATVWAPEDEAAVAEAERIFKEATAQGRAAFATLVGQKPEEAERVREFNPEAEEIVIIAPMAGGY